MRKQLGPLALLVLIFLGCSKPSSELKGTVEVIPNFGAKEIPDRQIEIYLPPKYDSSASYPVIYMHDGQNVFNANTSSYGTAWEVDDKMDSMLNIQAINPAIIVAIWNNKLRWNEYLPEPCFYDGLDSTMEFPEMRQSVKDTSTYSDKYLGFIATELKPYIDQNYATNPTADHTFLMGSSMGGLISFYGNILHPDVFGGAACISTHWTALDAGCLAFFREVIPDPHSGKRFYFDHGNRGLDTAYNQWQPLMDRAMKRSGYKKGDQWASEYFAGADHNEASWQQRVQVPLQFLLGNPTDSKQK